MENKDNYYRALFGFPNDLNLDDDIIKAKFRELAKKYHPDSSHKDSDDNFKIICDAKDYLLSHKNAIIHSKLITKNIALTPKQAFKGCKIKIGISNKKSYIVEIPPLANNDTTIIRDIVCVKVKVDYPTILLPIDFMDLLFGTELTIKNIFDTGEDYTVCVPPNTNPQDIFYYKNFLKCRFKVIMPDENTLNFLKKKIRGA